MCLNQPTLGQSQLIDAGISIKHWGEVNIGAKWKSWTASFRSWRTMVRLRGLINSPCLCHDEYRKELTDQEVYDSLPIRVNGQVWARIARPILVHVSQPQPLRSTKAVASPLVQQPRHRYSTWEPRNRQRRLGVMASAQISPSMSTGGNCRE